MLWTIAIILAPLAAGAVSSDTMGGFVHILLVFAIVIVLIDVIQGRVRRELKAPLLRPAKGEAVGQERTRMDLNSWPSC